MVHKQPTPEELAQRIERQIAALRPHATDMRKLAQQVRAGKISQSESERVVARTIEQLSRLC